jgi:hypothetical protein
MTLPREIRDLIWWETLRPEDGIVRITPYILDFNDLRMRNRSRIGGPGYQLTRFSVPGFSLFGRVQRETWGRLGENHYEEWSEYNLLRVSRQVYGEAEGVFWRRVAGDRLMLSFGAGLRNFPPGYEGLVAAHTFLSTLIRDDPNNPNVLFPNPRDPQGPMVVPEFRRFTQHTRGIDFLPLIRRVHLDLTNQFTCWQARAQTLAPFMRPGRTNAIQYIDTLFDNMYDHLTGLQHLSLVFSGWVPDVRRTPVSDPQISPIIGNIEVPLVSDFANPPLAVGRGLPGPQPRISNTLGATDLSEFSALGIPLDEIWCAKRGGRAGSPAETAEDPRRV